MTSEASNGGGTIAAVPQQAMVLAAGLGTRMRPLTDTTPKPLIEVAGRSLLDRTLDTLASAGVARAVVNGHHLADQIEAHLAAHDRGPTLAFSDERAMLLDSGGGVSHALPLLNDGPLLVANSDTFWVEDEPRALAAMAATRCDDDDVVLLLARREEAVGFAGAGDFMRGPDGTLTRRGDAPNAPYVYAGALLAHTHHFADPPDAVWSLNRLFDAAIAEGRLRGAVLDGLWLHVGTPEAIGEAEAALAAFVRDSR